MVLVSFISSFLEGSCRSKPVIVFLVGIGCFILFFHETIVIEYPCQRPVMNPVESWHRFIENKHVERLLLLEGPSDQVKKRKSKYQNDNAQQAYQQRLFHNCINI